MNIAKRLLQQSIERPTKDAVIFPKKGKVTKVNFKELEENASRFAYSLEEWGLKKGMKTLIFIRPSLDFSAITFALFKIGVIPIFIDPGMGKKNLLMAISQIKPEGLIAVPEIHFIKKFYRNAFSSVKIHITTGVFRFGKLKSLRDAKIFQNIYSPTKVQLSDQAAVLFTSGGTGIPKGVEYTHKIFNKQTELLQNIFQLTPKDVDVAGFPLFALFTLSMGLTSCIPEMDPSRPAQVNPKKLVDNIKLVQGSFLAGSPAIWERVADYCIQHKLTLPSVKYLVMFGAPVSIELHRKFKNILINGTTYTPYGATESLPISNISGKEILRKYSGKEFIGKGTCIGSAVPEIQIEIIPITDEIIESIENTSFLSHNQMGEIIVKGDVVTKQYIGMPTKTAEAKIYDGDDLWHRVGDIGHKDQDGKIWFCGRKSHRVQTQKETLSSIQCESVFNQHNKVKRSALISIPNGSFQKAGLVIEPKDMQDLPTKKELEDLGKEFKKTEGINDFYIKENFPVDVRHNIKIDRLKLREISKSDRLS